MAFQQVYTFTPDSGITYYLYADFDNNLVKTENSDTPGPLDTTVTEVELQVFADSLYSWACVGTTKRNAVAQLNYPFIRLEDELNNIFCGYSPPSCSFDWTRSSSNATNGNNNGSITVNVSTPGTYQYSLDNSTWQTSPVFNFLFPGTYNVYVRNTDGCSASKITFVGNTVIAVATLPPLIPYQSTNRICYFFKLIIGGVETLIREPIKWDDVNIVGERDADYHGYLFKYTDGDVVLGFDCAAGRDLIEAEYNSKGQDGDVKFQYGYAFEGVDYILFSGKLMLNTYKWYVEKVECSVETEDLDTIFTSRLETKVSMTQDISFDGDAVPAPSPYQINLHAKQILTRVQSSSENKTYQSIALSNAVEFIFIKPDNLEPTLSEIEDNYQYPLGSQVENPVDVDEYLLDLKTDGTAEIEIDLDMDVIMNRLSFPFGGNYNYTADVRLVKRKFNINTNAYSDTIQFITTTPVAGVFPSGGGVVTTNFNIKGAITDTDTYLAGDKVYVFIAIVFENDNFKYSFNLAQNNFTFNVNYLETSVATPANVWFLEDVIRHCINVISNNKYAFKSSFFERKNVNQLTDGCGSKYILTNGFQIRQFDIANRPLKIDLKNILKSLASIFCIGLNYSNDEQGEYVRIERVDHYYQEREILAIETVDKYYEEVATDIIYNELELGYEKFQDSGFNSLDEFNTKTEWLTPIKKNKKKLSQLSSFISSGYSIEEIRRNQFQEKPSSSVTNDEEPFIISVKRTDSANWATEKNEAFETVTGIISPETAYNLRISPKRILYNWFIWLKGIFAYKQDADMIINTFIAQNNDLITRFNSDEQCRVGDVDRSTIAEKDNVTMTALASTADIYRPERANITCRLSPQQVQLLNLAMTSRYGESKDRGYIMVKKPNSAWQAIWVDKLSYNFWTEKAQITGKKKFESPAMPDSEDCCRWLTINGCYLLVNGERIVA